MESLAQSTDPQAAAYVHWEREQQTAIHLRWQEEQLSAGRAIAEANVLLAQHDYDAAACVLARVNPDIQSKQVADLMQFALERQQEVDLLIDLIERGLRSRNQPGMFRNVQRLMQLKPKDRVARDLYRKYRWRQRAGRIGLAVADVLSFAEFGRRRTDDEPILRKWLAAAAAVGLVSFGLMTWAMNSYLNDEESTTGSPSSPSTGLQCVDFNGNRGEIDQLIDTEIGKDYQLTFFHARHPNIETPSRMRVEWNGTVIADLTDEITGRTRTDMKWKRFDFKVQATQSRSRLTFKGSEGRPVLDDVSLVLDAEP